VGSRSMAISAVWRALCVAAGMVALCGGATALGQVPGEPLLVLVSFDGFRWDYLEKATAPNLRSLITRGVRAAGLIPSFPAKTFPNHYTIVTGLYPGRHGIVANTIRDLPSGRVFAMSRPREVGDAMWWGGEPIWVTVERAGRRAATMFWPGSEAAIGGIRPSYWKTYQESMAGNDRVDQALRWMDLPRGRRPSLVTLYFEDVDSDGHAHGPESPEVRRAIERVDGYLGRLLRGLASRGLASHANVVVVSDHGMAATVEGRVLELDDYITLSDVDVVDINPTIGLFPRQGREETVYRLLARASPHLRVYRRAEIPEAWHYRHPRVPPIVGVVEEGWQIVRGSLTDRALQHVKPLRGAHGYDPGVAAMRGIFIAAGPAFRTGATVPAFENVHVYNALAAALAVRPAPNDGDAAVARTLLR